MIAEEYVPLGHSEFSSVINKFRSEKPNVIFSTVVGDSVVALHRQYRAAGLDPATMPMASLTTSENEVAAMGGDAAAGHFTSAPYFMVFDSPENQKFVEAYKKRWGGDKVTHFVSESSYFQVHLFKQAVAKLAASDIGPLAIRDAVKGEEFKAPQGLVKVEPQNLHCWLRPKIGQCKPDGQFEILKQSADWLEPNPYSAYPNQKCTAEGSCRPDRAWTCRRSDDRRHPSEKVTDGPRRLANPDRPQPLVDPAPRGAWTGDHLRRHGRHQFWRMANSSCSGLLRLASPEPVRLEPHRQSRADLPDHRGARVADRGGRHPPPLRQAARHHPRHLGPRRDDAADRAAHCGRRTALRPDAPVALRQRRHSRRHGFRLPALRAGAAIGLFALTWYIYRYTSFGLQLRAITQNRAIASSFGINSGRAYRLTFAYGAGIAGLAGALISPLKSVSPEMGTTYVVDAFMVVVLGGVQSLLGTLASSAVLGEVSGLLAYYSNDTIAKALVSWPSSSSSASGLRACSRRACAPDRPVQREVVRPCPENTPHSCSSTASSAWRSWVPMFVGDAFLLNKYARYLIFGMLAIALSLSWGYAGILNLGQATTFGLGSYCMAMFLKLKTVPVHTGSDGLPDFMVWNNVTELPWLWWPFYSMPFALLAGILVPALFAALLGWFMFGGRVTGVYAAIITLAVMVVVNLIIVDQQSLTGGFNGITDLAQFEMFGFTFDAYSASTYYLVAICLSASLMLGLAVSRSKTGLILQAVRDQEERVRFFGYDVALYKTFVFALSAGIAGLAGMLYTIVMEFASPTFLGVPLSLLHRHLGRRRRAPEPARRHARGAPRHRRAGSAVGIRDLPRDLDAHHGRALRAHRPVHAEGTGGRLRTGGASPRFRTAGPRRDRRSGAVPQGGRPGGRCAVTPTRPRAPHRFSR